MNNEKVNLDSKALKFLFNRYKDFGIPIFVIAICLAVFIQFLFPQLQNLFILAKEAKEASGRIGVLKNNIRLLTGLNDSALESYLQIANAAVPVGKDFIGIINAILYASNFSGVPVKEYQLKIGDLSEEISNAGTFSSISVNLSIDGDINDLNKFIEALNTTLPLSEASNITLTTALSTVDVNFYYKPLPPIKPNDFSSISPISENNLTLIKNLSKFNYSFSGKSL